MSDSPSEPNPSLDAIDELLAATHGSGVRFIESQEYVYVEPLHAEIAPDPTNSRPKNSPSLSKEAIEKLASSIEEIGLLQNLVVRSSNVYGPSPEPGKYTIRAGERRWRAIGVLIERGTWPPDKPILCRLVEEGRFEHIAENVGHEHVPPWHLGVKYHELLERGFNQKDIARKIGKSQQHVSICCRVARGLSPAVKERLDRLGASSPNIHQVTKIAELTDKITGAPDEERQMKLLEKILFYKSSNWKHGKSEVRKRIDTVNAVQGPHRPVLQAAVRYILGFEKELRLP